jgi:hypothetical protein
MDFWAAFYCSVQLETFFSRPTFNLVFLSLPKKPDEKTHQPYCSSSTGNENAKCSFSQRKAQKVF